VVGIEGIGDRLVRPSDGAVADCSCGVVYLDKEVLTDRTSGRERCTDLIPVHLDSTL